MIITREQAITYLDSLGDSVNWTGWTLKEIRAEVLKGDDYDGMNIWENMLISCDADDIDTKKTIEQDKIFVVRIKP